MYPISRSTRASTTQRASDTPETREAAPAPARSLTRSMAGLNVRDATRSADAAPMAPRAALKRPDAGGSGHAARANRHVVFEAQARAKPADGADSFTTQVKFAERPGRHRGASTSGSSQPPSTPSRTPPAGAGQASTSGKSGGGLLNRLFGGSSRRDPEPSPAASNAAHAPHTAHARHAPHAAQAATPARTSEPGAPSPVRKFNDLAMAFMKSGADHGQKERLSEALAGGMKGFRKFLGSGEINRTLDKGAGRLLVDLANAFHKLTPADEHEMQVAIPARKSQPGAPSPLAKLNDLVMAFMESGADHGQKERLSKALAGGAEGVRKFLMSGEINRILDENAGRLLMDLAGALRKLSPEDEFNIRQVKVKPQAPAGR